jgi:hypothetical protein
MSVKGIIYLKSGRYARQEYQDNMDEHQML